MAICHYVFTSLTNLKWQAFLAQNNGRLDKSLYLTCEPQNITTDYLQKLWDFILQHPFKHHRYPPVGGFESIKSLPSCPVAKTLPSGKPLAVRPPVGGWHTPDAPNNIIHVRLATCSVVEQMNAHLFARLHTALTHNGETTNYEALKQRVEFSNSPPIGELYQYLCLRHNTYSR